MPRGLLDKMAASVDTFNPGEPYDPMTSGISEVYDTAATFGIRKMRPKHQEIIEACRTSPAVFSEENWSWPRKEKNLASARVAVGRNIWGAWK